MPWSRLSLEIETRRPCAHANHQRFGSEHQCVIRYDKNPIIDNHNRMIHLVFDSIGQMVDFKGKKFFIIPHQYGTEDIEIDLEEAESGWVLIGSFQLEAGPNKIELTDKNEAGYVLADAVKWVKK